MDAVFGWVATYGYGALFGLLIFGVVGLPIPDETLLVFCGYLISKGKMNLDLQRQDESRGNLLRGAGGELLRDNSELLHRPDTGAGCGAPIRQVSGRRR